MTAKLLYRLGLRSWPLHTVSLFLVGLCLSLWVRAKTVDQAERGNAERRAMFVGLWPSMFWLIADALEREERAAGATWPRGRRRRAG